MQLLPSRSGWLAGTAIGLLVVMGLLTAAGRVHAQEIQEDVVTLVSGRTITGKIVEAGGDRMIRMVDRERSIHVLSVDSIQHIESHSLPDDGAERDNLRSYVVFRDSTFIYGEIVEQIDGNNLNTYRRNEFERSDVRQIEGTDTVLLKLKNGWRVWGTEPDFSRKGDLTLRLVPSILVRKYPNGELVAIRRTEWDHILTERPAIAISPYSNTPDIAPPDTVVLTRAQILRKKRRGVGAEIFTGYPLYLGLSAGFDLGSGWGLHLSLATDNVAVALAALMPDSTTGKLLGMQESLGINLQGQITMPFGEDWGMYIGGGISYEDFGKNDNSENGYHRKHPSFSGGLHWYFSDKVYLTGGFITQPLSMVFGIGLSGITSPFFLNAK